MILGLVFLVVMTFVGGFGAFVELVGLCWRARAFVGVPAYVSSAVLARETLEDCHDFTSFTSSGAAGLSVSSLCIFPERYVFRIP